MTERLDPHAQRLLGMLALSSPRAAAMTVADRRAAFRNLMRFSGPGPAVGTVEDMRLVGTGWPLRVRIYTPINTEGPLPGLVYFHGGGLVAGDLDTHDALCRAITQESGCRVLAIDYRLAPEHPFPAALDDARTATEWVFANAHDLGVDPDRVGIGGDSAGGTLAAIIAAERRRTRGPKLAFQLLLCPILDFAATTPSRRAFETPLLDQATMDRDIALYTGGFVLPSDPRISPLRADDFAGLPPTFIHTAQCDPLRDEGEVYATRLEQSGVALRDTCHAGMPHLFYAMGSIIPYAQIALQRIGTELAEALAQPKDRALRASADH